MPKSVVQSQAVTLTCDFCASVHEGANGDPEWYECEAIEEVGFRMFEKIKTLKHPEMSHIKRRSVILFCSPKCFRDYMLRSMELFMAEVKPPSNRSTSTTSLI